MANGRAQIFKCTTGGPYAYTWKDDMGQSDEDAVVVGKTLAQAYSEIGALAQEMAGTIKSVVIVVRSE
jgi:hypothetical protein